MQQPVRHQDPGNEQQSQSKPSQSNPNRYCRTRRLDLRSTLEWLRAEGELIETDKEVDPDLQVTGLQKHMDGGCPILFNTVKGKPNHRVITNLFGDMAIINRMFGWKDDPERVRKLAHALSHPVKPVEIAQSEAPCQEHVIEQPDDVNKWLVPIRHTTYEPELTVGSGIRCVTGAQFDGGSDLGYNRMNFRWGNVGTFQISPGSHMWQVVNKYYKEDQPVPITMCFGVPPACTLMAGAGFDYAVLPMGCDEIGIASAVQGAPIRLVKVFRTVGRRWRWPTANWCWKATSIRATLPFSSRPVKPRMPASRAAITSILECGRATWASPTRRHDLPCHRRHHHAPAGRSKPIIFALGVHMLDDHNIDTSVREAATATNLCRTGCSSCIVQERGDPVPA